MGPTVSTSSSSNAGMAKLKAALAKLARADVFVGVAEDHTLRNSGEMTNAALVYLHTHGSALQHIPARPIIEPAIEASDNRALITKQLGAAARALMDQKPSETLEHLDKAGMLGREAAQNWFTDGRNGWPANAPETIARKGNESPLIDTGQLRRAMNYVVEE
jgi:hypothetical protein